MQKKIVYKKFYYINETKLTSLRRIKTKVRGRKVFVSLPLDHTLRNPCKFLILAIFCHAKKNSI